MLLHKLETSPLRIAIVGGGFSGTLVLAHLAGQVPAGSAITVFDAHRAFGAGTAYATWDTCHLLNVQADRMGAFEADHFVRWLAEPQGRTAAARICPERVIRPSDYVPRALYGAYLKSILDEACVEADARKVVTKLVATAATDIRGKGRVSEVLSGRRWDRFDAVVLATGNQPPRIPGFANRSLARSSAYIADVWASGLPKRLPNKDATVLILGTGLTAIDVVLSLEAQGYEGRIVAVSRHGWLASAHAVQRPAPWEWAVNPSQVAPSAVAYLHWLKTEARFATASGQDWRSVFDALRSFTPALWRCLDDAEQRKVFRYHALWSVHRHRMAPEVAAKIDALRKAERLEIAAARIVSVKQRLGALDVRLRRRHSIADETLRPALVVNCTGSESDVTKLESGLFRRLLRRGVVISSSNGAGIASEPDGAARTLRGGRIFALGALMVGDQFECTAVPELREAARRVARQIIASTARVEPG